MVATIVFGMMCIAAFAALQVYKSGKSLFDR